MWQIVIDLALDLAARFSQSERHLSIAHDDHFAREYVATPDSVRARANLTPTDPRFLDPTRVVFEYVMEVKRRWDLLRADTAFVDRFTDARLNAAETDVERASAPVQPLRGLPRSDFGDKSFRIHLDHSVTAGGRTVTMRALVETTLDATTHPELDHVTATVASAIAVLLPLRRFDDTVIRLLAAREVKRMTGAPLPEILALMRAEGGLPVFPSASSVKDPPAGALPPVGTPVGNVPSATVADMVPFRAAWRADRDGVLDNANEGEITLIKIGFRPDISHLVWVADPTKPGFPRPPDDFHIKEFALAGSFAVQPIGGDVLASLFALYAYNARTDFADAYAQHSADKWRAAGFTVTGDPVVAARKRWTDMLGTLDLWRTRGHAGNLPEAVIVAPKDPVLLLAGVVAEGMALLRKLRPEATLLGPSFTAPLPVALAAMRYNAAMDADDKLVLAALVSALHTAVSLRKGFEALKTALRADPAMWFSDPAATTFLSEATKILVEHPSADDVETAFSALAKAKPGDPELVDKRLSQWLLRDNNKQLLFEFLMKAGSEWDSYKGMRNHLSRFNRMNAFFERVLA